MSSPQSSDGTGQVLVVVDPVLSGAALTPVLSDPAQPDVLLADLTARVAVAEHGLLVQPRLHEATQAAAAERVATELREDATVPFSLVDAAVVSGPTVLGDVIAEPDGAGRVLRDDCGRVLALRVPAADRSDLAAALDEVEWFVGERLLDLVARRFLDLGKGLRELRTAPFPVDLVATPEALPAALAAVAGADEHALRLRRSARADDGFLSTVLIRPLSRPLTRWAVATGRTPNAVTAVALALGLLAALAYVGGSRGWLVLGSMLLLLSLVVDCVDGEVARCTRTTSPRGAWLDVGADRIKEYAVYGALAAGACAAASDAPGNTAGDWRVWLLALACLALLVTRHFVDFGFAGRRAQERGAEGRVGAWSARTDGRVAVRHAKRAMIGPVGERTIVLAVFVPTAGVWWTFLILLAQGVVAAAWTTAGRLARARASFGDQPLTGPARDRLLLQVDGAPVPRWPVGGRWGWLLPALSRAVEQGGCTLFVTWLVPSALPGLFGWLAVVAIAEYDLTYRGRLTARARRCAPLAGLGWPVRMLAVLAIAGLAPAQAGVVLGVAAGVLAVGVLWSSRAFWRTSIPSSP